MEQDQEQEQKNQGAVGRINSFYRRNKRKKKAISEVKAARVGLTWGLPFLLILMFFIVFIGIFFIFSSVNGATGTCEGICYYKAGPTQVANGENIPYKIILIYDSAKTSTPLDSVTLIDTLPTGTEFVSASGVYDNSDPTTVSWKISDNIPESVSNGQSTYVFDLMLKPTQNDITIVNTINVDGGVGPNPNPNANCQTGDFFACLKDQFNVTVSGTSDQATAKFLYNTLSIPLSYPNYLKMFKSMRITINISNANTGINGSFALTEANGDITLYRAFFNSTRESTRRQYLIHETGHVVAHAAAGAAFQAGLYAQVHDKGLDARCFNNTGVIKTFPLPVVINKTHETFAESIADTVLCKGTGTCEGGGGAPIQDFPHTCSNTYNYIINRVL